jgi:beta-glucosidase
MATYKFPKGFYWGAATASHQVEGGTVNDWTEWEKKNAKRLAETAALRWQGWQREQFPEMFKEENYISGAACDHYNRYEEDFDIAGSLSHNAHRFSIEWSRIEPEEGKFDEKEIEHYRNVIRALRKRGMEPFITLWHWTNPVWIGEMGGWENKKTVDFFVRYAQKMASSFGDVRFWITINEPNISTAFGYITGAQPPGKKNILKAIRVFRNLFSAHKKACEAIRACSPAASAGTTINRIYFEPKSRGSINRILAFCADFFWNTIFFEYTVRYNDFVGCNYYKREFVGFGGKNTNKNVSDLGWEIYPEGIYRLLKELKKYGKPIYVFENGLADANDIKRAAFIKDHLSWVAKALSEGVDVRGYFHWSLLDNFEFPEVRGFWPRFGLVYVDFKTFKRTIRPSALEYKKLIEEYAAGGD